jgi:ubiquinone/menaquinone biosynthesis C-methylase UbiE
MGGTLGAVNEASVGRVVSQGDDELESLSFDGLVELYDRTRTFDQGCFDAALDYIVDRYPPRRLRGVFEPGIGTGRIAIPMAERGYDVTGVDVSEEMLAALESKLRKMGPDLPISWSVADVCRLPFDDGMFDMAVAVHLFYFIRDWRGAAREILRVVRRGGPVILMQTGPGAEIPFLNGRYKELCRERGCVIEAVGAASTRDVAEYYFSLGCAVEWVKDKWTWTCRTRVDEAIGCLRSRAYSFTTPADERTHLAAVERLEREALERFGSLDSVVEAPAQVYLVIVERQ